MQDEDANQGPEHKLEEKVPKAPDLRHGPGSGATQKGQKLRQYGREICGGSLPGSLCFRTDKG
jgi:hypothetical protein